MTDLLIVIGVAKPKGLAPLNGVAEACQSVLRWGEDSRFDVVPLLDSIADVDAPAIQAALPDTALKGRNRVIVYFCGHGFNIWGQVTWVLSPGADGFLGLLGVEEFKRALKTYGVHNISILGDACQTLAVPGLGATAILPPGPAPVWPPCLADTFYAAIPGQSALVLRDDVGRWRPVFSGALSDALTNVPVPAGVFDQQLSQAGELLVSSQSLGSYLEREVDSRSAAGGLVQYAFTNSGLRWPNNIYRKFAVSAQPKSVDISSIEIAINSRPSRNIEFRVHRYDTGKSNMDDWQGRPTEAAKEPAPNSDVKRSEAYRAKTNSEWRIDFWENFLKRAQDVNSPGSIEVVTEARAMPANVQPQPYKASALVAIDDHLWSVLPSYHEAICGLAAVTVPSDIHQRGIHAIGWHDARQWPENIKINSDSSWASSDDAMRVLKGFIGGTLNLSDLQATMENYRVLKHVNPVFGIVASYYYFSAGDIDSVIRTAGFYQQHYQPIPIDIALMTGAELVLRGEIVTVDLPAVPEAPHARDAPKYLWRAARANAESPVAGLLPVFRAGWSHLANARSELSRLGALERWLTNSPITAFDSPNGYHDFLEILTTIGVGK
ncbi:hypothetical protein C3941_18790 [Kaistia algarum]|uniref:hypothetical protein n=1 Tax=Kaistia algarum TaxID=2083279 RepID=UPI000CE8F891|nr:hypothetical protein [Kaistia algarum]MCX5516508.1 hypothetical protein [Kaistia algarum]PPE78375.1 hypothetical protein C3941_18790 [Kaistia algarum]